MTKRTIRYVDLTITYTLVCVLKSKQKAFQDLKSLSLYACPITFASKRNNDRTDLDMDKILLSTVITGFYAQLSDN
jgi:hypothetical protein